MVTLDQQIDHIQKGMIMEKSQLREVFENMDDDTVDPVSSMSKIDFNTRLTDTEIRAILVFDELQRIGIMPKNAGISRQLKRLKVSQDGKGRGEKVDMVRAEIGSQREGGFVNGIKRLFTPQSR